MAFRILTEEEKALLSEEQLKRYEAELDMYNKRVNFVKKLEKLENVKIEPYEVKKVKIKASANVEAPYISIPDTRLKAENKVSDKISEYKLFNKVDSEKMKKEMTAEIKYTDDREKLYTVIKKCSDFNPKKIVTDAVSVKIDKKDISSPEVKKFNAPSVPSVNIEKNECAVPEIKKVSVTTPVIKNIPEISAEKPDVRISVSIDTSGVSDINKVSAVKPVRSEFKLPDIKPEKVSVPEISEVNIKSVEVGKASLERIPERKDNKVPEISVSEIPSAKANVPEIKKPAIPSVSTFEKQKSVPSGMPQLNNVSVPSVNPALSVRSSEKINTDNIRRPDITKTKELKFEKPQVKPETISLSVPEIKPVSIKMPGVSVKGISDIRRPDPEEIKARTKSEQK